MNNTDLSPSSRVWIYAADRFFNEEESRLIKSKIEDFVKKWAAHGKELFAEGHLLENKFVVFFVDEEKVGVTGCSIDSSVAFIKSLEKEFDVDFFNRQQINYIEDGQIKQLQIHDFWAKRKANLIDGQTVVFDNLVKTKSEFEQSWKKPFAESWHQEMWD